MANVMRCFPHTIGLFFVGAAMSFSVTACADPAPSELHTKFVDAEVQEMLGARLRAEGIPFRQTPDGTIWYPRKEFERVRSIRQDIVKREYGGNAVHYDKPEHARLFREKLTQQGIPFQVKVRSNREQTFWSDANDPKVQKILIEVRQTIIEEGKAEILGRRSKNGSGERSEKPGSD